jgi:hypothetical protein
MWFEIDILEYYLPNINQEKLAVVYQPRQRNLQNCLLSCGSHQQPIQVTLTMSTVEKRSTRFYAVEFYSMAATNKSYYSTFQIHLA